jgi:hypothetical protein
MLQEEGITEEEKYLLGVLAWILEDMLNKPTEPITEEDINSFSQALGKYMLDTMDQLLPDSPGLPDLSQFKALCIDVAGAMKSGARAETHILFKWMLMCWLKVEGVAFADSSHDFTVLPDTPITVLDQYALQNMVSRGGDYSQSLAGLAWRSCVLGDGGHFIAVLKNALEQAVLRNDMDACDSQARLLETFPDVLEILKDPLTFRDALTSSLTPPYDILHSFAPIFIVLENEDVQAVAQFATVLRDLDENADEDMVKDMIADVVAAHERILAKYRSASETTTAQSATMPE